MTADPFTELDRLGVVVGYVREMRHAALWSLVLRQELLGDFRSQLL
jgi:hypothetical protein